MTEQQGLPTSGANRFAQRVPVNCGRAPLDFDAINRAAFARLEQVVERLLPGGRCERNEWVAGDLRGGPGRSLKVVLRGAKAGVWRDFAAAVGGADPVSLAAAVAGVGQAEGARLLAKMLGVGSDNNGR